jgi:AcrR family transcriptional regulator
VTDLDDLLAKAPPAKRAILTQALLLFASRGVEAVSVRDIAAASGFTNPALFRHFASKDELARALFETCYRELVQALEAVADEDSLEDWFAAIFAQIERSPQSVQFVLEHVRLYWRGLPEDLRARNLPALVRRRLERDQALGRLRADLNLALARTVVDGAIAQIARSAHFHQSPLAARDLARDLADLLLRGFGARLEKVSHD